MKKSVLSLSILVLLAAVPLQAKDGEKSAWKKFAGDVATIAVLTAAGAAVIYGLTKLFAKKHSINPALAPAVEAIKPAHDLATCNHNLNTLWGIERGSSSSIIFVDISKTDKALSACNEFVDTMKTYLLKKMAEIKAQSK